MGAGRRALFGCTHTLCCNNGRGQLGQLTQRERKKERKKKEQKQQPQLMRRCSPLPPPSSTFPPASRPNTTITCLFCYVSFSPFTLVCARRRRCRWNPSKNRCDSFLMFFYLFERLRSASSESLGPFMSKKKGGQKEATSPFFFLPCNREERRGGYGGVMEANRYFC